MGIDTITYYDKKIFLLRYKIFLVSTNNDIMFMSNIKIFCHIFDIMYERLT